MKNRTQILTWLKNNCGKQSLAPLSAQDANALLASVALCPLISWTGAPAECFAAYGAIVRQMQPQNRWLAYHAIAMELDWSHRAMIWLAADLPASDKPVHKAAFEPGGSARV